MILPAADRGESLLAALQTALPLSAASFKEGEASDSVVDWSTAAAALRALQDAKQRELSALETQAEDLDDRLRRELLAAASPPEDGSNAEVAVKGLAEKLGAKLPEVERGERHFSQLVALVKPQTQRLVRLEARAAFFAAALEVEQLSQAVKKHAIEATPEALTAFTALSTFVQKLPQEYTSIQEEAARRLESLAVDLRRFAVAKLQQSLESIDWPTPLDQDELAAKGTQLKDVSAAFAYLLTLQLSQQGSADSKKEGGQQLTGDLWAMDCVLDAVLVRFRYHFERDESATNRMAKPEWMLTSVLEQSRAHERFCARVLTPELRKRRDTLHCSDAHILLLSGLITAAQHQLQKRLDTLVAHPALLCHTIDEVLLFEQAVDEEFGYSAWTNGADRRQYPRCIDALTGRTDALFSWTKVDIEYALRVLEERAGEASNSSTADSPLGVDSTKVSAWEIAEAGSGDSRAEDELVPTTAVDLTLLLDFLCRRFTFMASDEHRYLYVVQVHHPLLRAFTDLCKTRGSRAVDRIQRTIKASESQHAAAWRDLFATVNALRFIATTLGAWEQSSEFLELSKKMARSETTRTQVLKIHLEYSKQRLTTAAKAASAVVLATEEAAAVRQALTGPGSMIGPTAAFSAAYSVGSKTMKSIFGGRNEDAAATSPTAAGERSGGVAGNPATDGVSSISAGGSVLRAGGNAHADVSSPEDDAETLLFSHSMFERQIAELRATESELLKNATDVLSVRLFEREMESYRCSSFWVSDGAAGSGDELPTADISSELAWSFTVARQVLRLGHRLLLSECFAIFWKPLAAALDQLMFAAFAHPPLDMEAEVPSAAGRKQFLVDLDALRGVFAASTKNAKAYLRKTTDLLQLLALPAAKLSEIRQALDQGDGESRSADAMEQLTTILEACGVYTLPPSTVLDLVDRRLTQHQ